MIQMEVVLSRFVNWLFGEVELDNKAARGPVCIVGILLTAAIKSVFK